MTTTRTLAVIERKLREHYGAVPGPPADGPFQLILWEQVAYLAGDDRRREAFELLARRVGFTPQEVLGASLKALTEIAAAGGAIAVEERAARMQESARRVMEEWDGDLTLVLGLPLPEATKALTKFPMIGRPGAEKILLLTGAHPVLALDSNGLRVLLRLGYGEDEGRYEKTYKSVQAATEPELREDCDWLIQLHLLLRHHGKELCRNTRPRCNLCPLTGECAFYAEGSGTRE